MSRLRLVAIPLAVLLLAVFAATTAAKPGGVTKHTVDILWKPDEQDTMPGATVVDDFESSGKPFGDAPAQTLTPRSQIGTDTRSGKWQIFINPGARGPNPGICKGTFELDRNVIETTQTTQTVEYGGTLKLSGCSNTKKFRNAKPGKFGDLRGESICTATRCRGGLEIHGSMRY